MENTGKCLHENSCPAVKETDQGDYLVIGRIVREGVFAEELARNYGLGIALDEVAVIVPRDVMPGAGLPSYEDAVTITEAEYERLKVDSEKLARMEAAGVVLCGEPFRAGGSPCSRSWRHVADGIEHTNAEGQRW